jgi:hypothetical protein
MTVKSLLTESNTSAKHLRSSDRALNHHVYPKIHYPEVYILEGGYSQYYKESAVRFLPLYSLLPDADLSSLAPLPTSGLCSHG